MESGTYVVIEVNVHTQEGKEINCRSYQMKNYESAPPSPQYKQVSCFEILFQFPLKWRLLILCVLSYLQLIHFHQNVFNTKLLKDQIQTCSNGFVIIELSL